MRLCIRIGIMCRNLTRNGGQGVSHLLTEILDYHEQPDVAKSMINRMKTRF